MPINKLFIMILIGAMQVPTFSLCMNNNEQPAEPAAKRPRTTQITAPARPVEYFAPSGLSQPLTAAHYASLAASFLIAATPYANPYGEDKNGNTSLIAAVKRGDFALANYLLTATNANPNIQNKDGRTALLLAAKKNQFIIAKSLLAHGANPNIQDGDGNTPLIEAAYKGFDNIIELLIQNNADLNIICNTDKTALHEAIEEQQVSCVKKLLKAGANPHIYYSSWDALGLAIILHIDNPLLQSHDLTRLVADQGLGTDKEIGNSNALAESFEKYIDFLECDKSADIIDLFKDMRSTLTIPAKSCFLTFTSCEDFPATLADSINALFDKILTIGNASLLRQLVDMPYTLKYFADGQWSLWLNKEHSLCVIIPENLVDTDAINKKYGLKNLRHICPNDFTEELKYISKRKTDDLINDFQNIIDIHSPAHPTYFYLDGHGDTNACISDIPLCNITTLLTTFASIGTQCLYICSCYSSGPNLLTIQESINTITQKRGNPIEYAIILQATSDVENPGGGDLHALFTHIHKFFENSPVPFTQTHAPIGNTGELTLDDGIKSFKTDHLNALPSIRMPGAVSFFRSATLPSTAIITMDQLNKIRQEAYHSDAESMEIDGAASANAKIIHIAKDKTSIQIFPCDLHDCTIVVERNNPLFWISKIPGQAQHFLGKVTYDLGKENQEDCNLQSLIPQYWKTLDTATAKCWFIDTFELKVNDRIIRANKLVIKYNPEDCNNLSKIEMAYTDDTGAHLLTKIKYQSPKIKNIAHDEFAKKISSWFDSTVISYAALYEATGGQEIACTAAERAQLVANGTILPDQKTTAKIAFEKFTATI